MKNMTLAEFANLLLLPGNDDVEFTCKGITYELNPYPDRICINRTENGKTTFQYFHPKVNSPENLVTKFLDAKLFEGKSLREIEADCNVEYTACIPDHN